MFFEELFYIKLCKKEKEMFEQIMEIRLLIAHVKRVCRVSVKKARGKVCL